MRLLLALAALILSSTTAVAQHQHGKPGGTPEAYTAAPAFGPDGTLWLVRPMDGRIGVLRSTDLGKTFSAPVMVTPDPMNLDWGPDARARIAVDPRGGLIVTFGIFQDTHFNGRAYFARSSDGTRLDQLLCTKRARTPRRRASASMRSTSKPMTAPAFFGSSKT